MGRDQDWLCDIVLAAQKAEEFLGDIDQKTFIKDEKTQAACIRQLEIIGEVVKRLSDETKSSFPEIPWKEWAGIRDILIHAYDRVDAVEVWKTLKKDVPQLLKNLR